MTPATEPLAKSSADLLREAVCQARNGAGPKLLDRAFAFAFRSMVYPQIWEDPCADMEALAITPQSRIMTIASGGCNVLSYLTANPAQIHAVDLNETHVALLKLKLAAAQHLPSHATFFRFFGGATDWRNARLYDQLIAPHLDAESRAYWEGREWTMRRRITRFSRNFYRYGLLGRFIGSAHLSARLLGSDPSRLLTARSRDEQRQIFEAELAPLFDKPLVRWATSQRASLFGLGIPPAQYDALCDGGNRAMSAVLRERCERLATCAGFDQNYFAWQAFARRYAGAAEGQCPPYLEQDKFALIRTRANRVNVQKQNMIHVLRAEPAESLDRYVLLDAQDWMDDTTLTTLWSQITRTAKPGARVIFRTAGGPSILPGRLPQQLLDCWRYEAETSARIHAKDRSAIYGGFHLYVKAD